MLNGDIETIKIWQAIIHSVLIQSYSAHMFWKKKSLYSNILTGKLFMKGNKNTTYNQSNANYVEKYIFFCNKKLNYSVSFYLIFQTRHV